MSSLTLRYTLSKYIKVYITKEYYLSFEKRIFLSSSPLAERQESLPRAYRLSYLLLLLFSFFFFFAFSSSLSLAESQSLKVNGTALRFQWISLIARNFSSRYAATRPLAVDDHVSARIFISARSIDRSLRSSRSRFTNRDVCLGARKRFARRSFALPLRSLALDRFD